MIKPYTWRRANGQYLITTFPSNIFLNLFIPYGITYKVKTFMYYCDDERIVVRITVNLVEGLSFLL